jgi:hypothetical protein
MVLRIPGHRVGEIATVLRGPGGYPPELITPRFLAGERVSDNPGRGLLGADPSLGFFNDIQVADLTDGLQQCLDAGAASSYDGSAQSWLDLTGNGYDYFLGVDGSATTTDPTFNGSAGGLSSSEYFSFDGGDEIRYDTSNETWMSNYHKADGQGTIIFWLYVIAGGGQQHCWSTGQGGAAEGFYITLTDAEKMYIQCVNGSIADQDSQVADTAANVNAWNFLAWSFDESATTAFFYQNGAINQAGGADTFTWSFGAPGTGAGQVARIGRSTSGTNTMDNGTRLGGMMFWEGVNLTEANLDTLWAAQRGRYGL